MRSAAALLAIVIGCGSPDPPAPAPATPAPAEAPVVEPACDQPYDCLCEDCEGTSRVAMCEGGRCATVDLTTHPLSTCTEDAECVVIRRDCCACREGHVAVRRGAEGEYYDRTCGETPICSPCESHAIPDALQGRCVEGHCAVVAVELPPPTCPPGCAPVQEQLCRPDLEPCTCGVVHQPFADCEPSPSRPCPSARAFLVACDPRCCAD